MRNIYWHVISLLYLLLAFFSWRVSRGFNKKFEKSNLRIYDLEGDKIITGGKFTPEGKVFFDYWKEVKRYFDFVTWINVAGFFLAGIASILTNVN